MRLRFGCSVEKRPIATSHIAAKAAAETWFGLMAEIELRISGG